jgi:hypothetical protein
MWIYTITPPYVFTADCLRSGTTLLVVACMAHDKRLSALVRHSRQKQISTRRVTTTETFHKGERLYTAQLRYNSAHGHS